MDVQSFKSMYPHHRYGRPFGFRCDRQLLSALGGVLILVFLVACGHARQASQSVPISNDWHEFQGTWTAAGSRNTMHLEGDRRAAIATYSGSLMLAGPSRPGIGFRSEAIVFSDTRAGLIGRAVWTDEKGDKVFSELRGTGTATDNKIVGTFVGGTGRYSGATGNYEFSWRFLIENEDGVVQGQSVALNGRVRVDSQKAHLQEGRSHS